MDGWAHPNVAVQLGSECVQRCRCSAEYCQRLMGGGGHIVSAPTKQKGPLGPVCMCRDFVIWHSVHGCYDQFPRSPDGTPKWQTWAQHISWPPSHWVYLRL